MPTHKRTSVLKPPTVTTPGFCEVADPDSDQHRSSQSDSWIVLAQRHVVAGKLLATNQLWPEAVYQLQQSVEKLVRALAVETGIVPPGDIRQTGHDSLRVFEILFENYETQAIQAEQITLTHPRLGRAKMAQWKLIN